MRQENSRREARPDARANGENREEQNRGLRGKNISLNQLRKKQRLTLTPPAAMAVALTPFWRLLTAVSVETIFTAALSVARAMALASACAVLFPAAEPQLAAWALAPTRAASTSEQMIAKRDMVFMISGFFFSGEKKGGGRTLSWGKGKL